MFINPEVVFWISVHHMIRFQGIVKFKFENITIVTVKFAVQLSSHVVVVMWFVICRIAGVIVTQCRVFLSVIILIGGSVFM